MIDFIQYCEIDGIRTFRDSEIMHLFGLAMRDGTYDRLVGIPPEQFMHDLKTMRGMELYVVRDDEKPFCMIIINNISGRRGFAHFCVFSEYWGDHTKITCAAMGVIDQLLDRFNTLVCVIREDDPHTKAFMQRLLYEPLCAVPGYYYDITSNRDIGGIMYLITKGV